MLNSIRKATDGAGLSAGLRAWGNRERAYRRGPQTDGNSECVQGAEVAELTMESTKGQSLTLNAYQKPDCEAYIT